MSESQAKTVTVKLNVDVPEERRRLLAFDTLLLTMQQEGLIPRPSTHFEDVRAFHDKFELMRADRPRHLTRRKLKERLEFMLEELQEFAADSGLEIVEEHIPAGDEPAGRRLVVRESGYNDQHLDGQADALVDIVYVALGTAVMLGLPWQELWNDVQRANMSKVRGVTKRGHAVDVTKPEGWIGPKGDVILRAHGYQREQYTMNGTWAESIEEEACHDD